MGRPFTKRASDGKSGLQRPLQELPDNAGHPEMGGRQNIRGPIQFRGLKQNGAGYQEWPNGDRYEGEWKDGQMHGKGALTDAHGNKREGTWKFDQFQ